MSGSTPLWNIGIWCYDLVSIQPQPVIYTRKVIIYIGIFFAFLVVCMFITILTPSIRPLDVLEAEKQQFPDEFWRKMRRQSYLGAQT